MTSEASEPTPPPHEVLGVAPDAGVPEIRRAYRKAAARWHPDRHPEDPAEAERRFLQIGAAYATLMAAPRSARRDRRTRNRTRRSSERPPPDADTIDPEEVAPSAASRRVDRHEARGLARELAWGERPGLGAEALLRGGGAGLVGGGFTSIALAPALSSPSFALGMCALLAGPLALGWAWIHGERRVEQWLPVAVATLGRRGARGRGRRKDGEGE